MSYIIRLIETTDEPFLWEMLYLALYVPPEDEPLPRNIILQPELAKYVENWQPDRDLGAISVLETDRTPVGAAWLTLFNQSNPGYGYINERTPELTIAVLPEYRGRGIGTKLLTQLLSQAKNHYYQVSLSVSLDNPALRLYRRLGFQAIAKHSNSLTMSRATRIQI